MIDEKKLIGSSTWHPDILSEEKPTWKDGWNNCNRDWMKRIDELPKVILPEITITGWIPCSERLPKYTDEYNVTIGISNMAGYCEHVTTLKYVIINGKHIGWQIPKSFDEIITVIAWMPLPEPFKEGGAV